jgi:asparagine synthase (glutamine-hydrolysing)
VAYASFHAPLWEALFRGMDAESTRVPMETRQPFVDLRVLRYMMAVPAVPWCRIKYLERRAMRGILPSAVLRRPKSPLAEDPIWSAARGVPFIPKQLNARLGEYIDWDRVVKESASDRLHFWIAFRPLALNYWLRNLTRTPSPLC